MDNDIKKIINPLQQIKLAPHEKAEMRALLVQKIGENSSPKQARIFPWHSIIRSHALGMSFASLIIVGVLGGTMSVAAEKALPGQLLYPIKIYVNENVSRLLITTSLPAVAEFETNLVEKRLVEAERLSEVAELTDVQKQQLEESFVSQTARAVGAIEKNRAREEKNQPTTASRKQVDSSATIGAGIESGPLQIQSVAAPTSTSSENSDLDEVFEKHDEIIKKITDKHGDRSRKD